MINRSLVGKSERDYTVFISCSYEPEYREVLMRLVLAVIAAGYQPRCDYDNRGVRPEIPEPLFVAEHIAASRYSIIECSCCRAAEAQTHARFHLPLELGMCLHEWQRTSRDERRNHQILVLHQSQHTYAHFLATLSKGQSHYYERPHHAMVTTFQWLASRSGDIGIALPKPKMLEDVWQHFDEWRNQEAHFDPSYREICEQMYSLLAKQTWWSGPRWERPDVFIAYNTVNRDEVAAIVRQLQSKGVYTWMDTDVTAGIPVLEIIEHALVTCKSAAVFFGGDGFGKWQAATEYPVILARFVQERIPVIPVILPSLDDVQKLPSYLNIFRWIQFSQVDDGQAINDLVRGITGRVVV